MSCVLWLRMTDPEIEITRVVLGELADYAYRIVTDMGTLRDRPGSFIVLVDQHGSPQLAPSDFAWRTVGGGRRAYPEKVVPEDPDLLRHLRRNGDLIDADRIAHPRASSPAVWAQEFVSHLTATIADELGASGKQSLVHVRGDPSDRRQPGDRPVHLAPR